MEYLVGKRSLEMSREDFVSRLAGCSNVFLDLGTGDGRYVLSQVKKDPSLFGIGLDACRENLRLASRKSQSRTLFVIANALNMPLELAGQVNHLCVNFPWGSLLQELLAGRAELLQGMAALCSDRAELEVRLNADALREAGASLSEGPERIIHHLNRVGFQILAREALGPEELKSAPTTWAQRIAVGRAPRGILLRGRYQSDAGSNVERVNRS